jgi:hypothetical protein
MIIRTYRCNDCDEIFEVTCESSDGDPDCPYCKQEMVWQPTRFAIGTNKGKAVDVTQKIMEEDYGLTDFNDNMREGDIAAKTPARTREEREAIEQMERDAKELAASAGNMVPQAREFFSGNQTRANVAAAAFADAKATKGEHRGMDLMMAAGKRGELPLNYRLVDESGRTVIRRAS